MLHVSLVLHSERTPGVNKPSHELWIWEVTEAPDTIRAIANALGCSPLLEHKALLLKIPHTLVVGHWEVKLNLSYQFSSHWLAFTVPEGATEAAGVEKSPYPSVEPRDMITTHWARYAKQGNSDDCREGHQLFYAWILGPPQERTHSWY